MANTKGQRGTTLNDEGIHKDKAIISILYHIYILLLRGRFKIPEPHCPGKLDFSQTELVFDFSTLVDGFILHMHRQVR